MFEKILAVGRAEYLQAVRSKAFLIGLLAMPLFMGGSILVQIFLKGRVDLTTRTCAVVDPTGKLWPVLQEAARKRNEEGIWSEEDGERVQKRPRFELELYTPKQADEAVDWVLSERVRSGELDGFLLLEASILDPEGEVGERPAAYHTDEPTFTELPRWLGSVIDAEVRRIRFEAAGLDPTLVARLSVPVKVGTWGLASRGKDGEVLSGRRENELRTILVPAAAMFLLFMLIMSSAPALMNQVLEEKMLRISEVLVSAVSPFQLMLGKLVGSVGISLTLGSLYLGGTLWATHHFGVADLVPWSIYGWFILMLILALFMYGSVLSALGSACSELRDAQSMMMPAMLVILIPMFAWNAVLEAPNGSVATLLTFIPTATPMILLLRLASSPPPPVWQVASATALCLATTVLFVWASAKIFRIGVLSQGQTPSLRKVLGWIFAKG